MDLLRIPVAADLELRGFREQDNTALFSLIQANRERLGRWLPWVAATQAADDTLEFIRASIATYEQGLSANAGLWVDGRLSGAVGIRIDPGNHSGSLGYWLDSSCEGGGYMTRAAAAMVRYGFETSLLHRLEIRCHPANLRSRAIPQRLGFREEGLLREAFLVNGEFQDMLVYGRLAKDRISS